MGTMAQSDFVKGQATETKPAVENCADAELMAEMKARLTREVWASNRGIWVDARDGIISLVGVVNSETEKAVLAAMAREIDGCKEVENHLLVKTKWRDYGIAY